MALTAQDISRVAHLARLELEPEESARALAQINGFFALVDQMAAVPTEGLQPMAHPVELIGPVALRLREDAVTEPDDRQANQQNAPALERGLFLVPRVIE